ncbi:MAG: hypothetical protein D6753_03735 [Planctomycetota bacterium]|nr:MAG: hypothetical protein D6753_03735 [Planctomycetota bacterium]
MLWLGLIVISDVGLIFMRQAEFFWGGERMPELGGHGIVPAIGEGLEPVARALRFARGTESA